MTQLKWGGESFPGLTLFHQGKVRDTYALPHERDSQFPLASNRVSIFDFVLNAQVEDKGAILTAMNVFWRKRLGDMCGHDFVACGRAIGPYLPPTLRNYHGLQTQGLVVRKAKMFPIEAIVRGYLTGSSLKPYRKENRVVCGHLLPEGLQDGSELPEPIFTPTTKAEEGHDEHLTYQSVRERYGRSIEDLSLRLYASARDYAKSKGIIVADTKFEFGLVADELVLADEVLTPDSSRFWKIDDWEAALREGRTPKAYDKQFVRNWGITLGIDKRDPKNPDDYRWVRGQVVPQEILAETSRLYHEIFSLLTNMSLAEFQRHVMGIGL